MSDNTIAFFPEVAYGPALNSVGIAQRCRELGHRVVFLCDPGFAGVFEGYGFEERTINMSEPMAPEEMARYWSDFINGHIPNFGKSPYDQIDNYVKDCWTAIIDTAIWAEKGAAAGPRRAAARPRLCRQCHPLPSDQALRRALGANHLV